MKIKLLLLIPLLFLTGCSIEYNLAIDSNFKVIEELTAYENNNELLRYYDNIESIPSKHFYQYKNMGRFKKYSLTKELFEKEKTGGIVKSSKYKIADLKDSPLIETLFSNFSINEYGDMLSIQATGYNYSLFEGEGNNIDMEDIIVNVKLQHEVIDNNADRVDEKTNTYTWVLNNDVRSGNIYFVIDKSKKKYGIQIKDFFNSNLSTIYTISAVIGIILLVAIYFAFRLRKINKI